MKDLMMMLMMMWTRATLPHFLFKTFLSNILYVQNVREPQCSSQFSDYAVGWMIRGVNSCQGATNVSFLSSAHTGSGVQCLFYFRYL